MLDTMPKKIIRCGFRSGFIIGFAFALVCIQIFAFSRVSDVLFEGESSAPDHHESFKREKEMLGKSILGILPRETDQKETISHSDTRRHSEEVSPDGIVIENKEGNLRIPAVPDLEAQSRDHSKTTRESPSERPAVVKDLVSSEPMQTLPTLQLSTQNPKVEDIDVEDGEIADCVIDGNADARSALDRATTSKCKGMIRNVTCLQMKDKLYDLDVHNHCPRGVNFLGDTLPTDPLPLGQATGSDIRIVYVLVVHGRALRQIKMLLKALYHRDHYFYIHVDQRANYLHREILEVANHYPNVLVTPWRLATIWGGASLLQMLLRVMSDVDKMTDWRWDYIINLSAADYPLKTDDELRTFLSVYHGKNFVKTHRRDTKRFIQKQGLDRTFVECDNHMWRVGRRPIPANVVIDGGSDWIILHRDFVHYLVNSKDQYLTALKRYFEFTLLPAESFFHTVVRNGNFCTTMITSNLHVLNWKREIGCSCQYKQIVDWCGCSPNDFLPSDANWLMKMKSDYFARKFEPVVSHEVVLRVDAHLYGDYPPDTPGLHTYWESVYHSEDRPSLPGDSAYSLYMSFMRIFLAYIDKDVAVKCDIHVPTSPVIHEVSALFINDEFMGYIVTIQDKVGAQRVGPLYQIYMKRHSHLVDHEEELEGDTAKRLVNIKVGTNWDMKERIFRDFGGVVGPHNDAVVGMLWRKGPPFEFTVEWTDPTGWKRESKVRVKADTTAFTDKITTPKPLKPGIWKVQVLMGKSTVYVLMETKFLVIPLTHYSDKSVLAQPWKTNGRFAPSAIAENGVSEEELADWKKNVQSKGRELDSYVDSLVGQFWHRTGVCVQSGETTRSSCPQSLLPDCQNTPWSSFSPDPKSELVPVKDNGRIR